MFLSFGGFYNTILTYDDLDTSMINNLFGDVKLKGFNP